MCGVLGYIDKNIQQVNGQKALSDGINALRHRGPDGSGMFVDSSVGLGHVRLSILDLTDAGQQPFSTSCGRFIISYNGEVYNFKEIAAELGITNRRSGTDTEVIVRGFEKIGAAIFSKLNGMFAFAIFDKQSRKMWLVRDRMGIKSLYYRQSHEAFWFASEVKGIFAMEGKQSLQNLNKEAVHEWSYFGSSLGEHNLFSGVKRLLPGHYMEIDVDTHVGATHCYWSISTNSSTTLKQASTTALIEKTRMLLDNAVKRQLVSDVPVGVFLSGGIDSSAITAFASKHYQGTLSTYSVAFDFSRENNELPIARLVAKKFNTDHHEIQISGVDIANVVERMVHHHDAPFSDAANIPLYLLCNAINSKTKVVLQGDGGDELFGGYQRYNTLAHFKKMRLRAMFGRYLNHLTPATAAYYRRRRYINALLAEDNATLMALLLTVEDRLESPLLIFSDTYRKIFEPFNAFARYQCVEQKYHEQALVDRMFSVDQSIILPDVFFEKVDKASMAASVEVRVPFMDNDLIDFCISLNAKQKLHHGIQKWLLKQSLEGIVPREVLLGKKRGFGVPYGYWIKSSLSELFQDHLLTFTQRNPDVLNMSYINQLIQSHKAGLRDFGFILWKILNFVIWSNQNKMVFHYG